MRRIIFTHRASTFVSGLGPHEIEHDGFRVIARKYVKRVRALGGVTFRNPKCELPMTSPVGQNRHLSGVSVTDGLLSSAEGQCPAPTIGSSPLLPDQGERHRDGRGVPITGVAGSRVLCEIASCGRAPGAAESTKTGSA